MKTSKFILPFSFLFILLVGRAAEQDNWYLAKEWPVTESRGVYYERNSTTGQGRIFVGRGSVWDTTGRDIKIYDTNGTLQDTFGTGNFMDLTMDGNGTLYTVSHNRVVAYSKSPGRVVSVTVDANGSNLYKHWNDQTYTLTFSGGGGTGASAHAVLDSNSSDTDSYNKFVSSVIVINGGSDYASEPNATLRSDMPKQANTVEANFTAVIGTDWGEDWSTGGFSKAQAIAISPNTGDLFVADAQSMKIQVLDRNGTIKREFGSSGSSPGQFNFSYSQQRCDLAFLSNGNLAVTDQSYLHFFKEDGTFVSRTNITRYRLDVAKDGNMLSYGHLRDEEGNSITSTPFSSNSNYNFAFTPQGDVIESTNTTVRLWKRAFRTKGMIKRNVIPQPAIRAISQRAGTNVMDFDFEIIDPDDVNVTVGIIAHCGSDLVVPQAWIEGTGSKIGTPVATNQIHRMSWDVKQDWPTNTGTIKFEILCQDANRSKPVDLHFLTLPFSDGNMTITRSPLNDDAFKNYAKFLLATGQAQFESNESLAIVIPGIETNATQTYHFTNAGATGRNGPSASQLIAEYNGTNLEGNVTTGFQSGYQKWTVPATGTYAIEAVGARGGNQLGKTGGSGAYVQGHFNLTAGQQLTLVVGQAGEGTTSNGYGTAAGGGTFVVSDTNNTPLLVAGGGGGAGGSKNGGDALVNANGQNGYSSGSDGGANGFGGLGISGGGGGGFLGSGTGDSDLEGLSFQLGAIGGNGGRKGGFGGGGATYSTGWYNGGGGGGYSGGGGSNSGPSGQNGGGGGSFNAGSNQLNFSGVGNDHGYVRIFRAESVNSGKPQVTLLDSNWNVKSKSILLNALGSGYRFATAEEVTKAREAATPGSVNNWPATFQVKPRNLPGSVNEYGFDVQTTTGTWVIRE
ncbi:MAG: hypothetical protein HN531_07010 [Opitutae bacterium]|nr:hypothetical protein [Opitutae bacterium]